MWEVWQASIAPANLALSILLALCLLYWVAIILTGLGVDVLDFDLDALDDVSVDAGDAPDLPGGAGHGGGMAHAGLGIAVLKFFHVGTVPVMVLISVLLLSMWTMAVLLHPIVGAWTALLQVLMLLAYLAAGLVVTKIGTLPLRRLFAKLREDEEHQAVNEDLVGKLCHITAAAGDDRGQAEIDTGGAPLLINVRAHGGVTLAKGDPAVVVDYNRQSNLFIVRPFQEAVL